MSGGFGKKIHVMSLKVQGVRVRMCIGHEGQRVEQGTRMNRFLGGMDD